MLVCIPFGTVPPFPFEPVEVATFDYSSTSELNAAVGRVDAGQQSNMQPNISRFNAFHETRDYRRQVSAGDNAIQGPSSQPRAGVRQRPPLGMCNRGFNLRLPRATPAASSERGRLPPAPAGGPGGAAVWATVDERGAVRLRLRIGAHSPPVHRTSLSVPFRRRMVNMIVGPVMVIARRCTGTRLGLHTRRTRVIAGLVAAEPLCDWHRLGAAAFTPPLKLFSAGVFAEGLLIHGCRTPHSDHAHPQRGAPINCWHAIAASPGHNWRLRS